MNPSLDPISLTESKRLNELEAVIKLHGAAFVAVGDALTEIRDKKLYRSEHGTFESYCKDVWGWSGSRARQICTAATFAKSVTTGNAPQTEREARKMMADKKLSTVPMPDDSRAVSCAAARQSVGEAQAGNNLTHWGGTPAAVESISPALRGIDLSKLDKPDVVISAAGAKLVEMCELTIENMRYVQSQINDGDQVDCAELGDIKEQFKQTVKAFEKWQQEVCK